MSARPPALGCAACGCAACGFAGGAPGCAGACAERRRRLLARRLPLRFPSGARTKPGGNVGWLLRKKRNLREG